ncbi:hypothetical protein K3217_20810 [bacterium BD-1]|uniref:hypothetical protein n=1 Tax=Arenimonas sp. TaxID=1872635 RepID=UPI001E62A7E8|nr:hypothetical protein [Ottowia caeni]
MTAINRSAQKWTLGAGVALLLMAATWLATSVRVGHLVVSYRSASHTGPVAWFLLGLTLLCGASLVVSAWRNLRKGRHHRA